MSFFNRRRREHTSSDSGATVVSGIAPAPGPSDDQLRPLLEMLGTAADATWSDRRPAARLATRRLGAGETTAVGTSKFGGSPDLPADVPWPTWKGPDSKQPSRPLNFFAQIRLEWIGSHLGQPFPEAGTLLFFADFDYGSDDFGITGLYEDERLGARVLYVPADVAVRRVRTPAGMNSLPEALVAPILTTTFREPDFEDVEEDIYDAYDEMLQAQAGLEVVHAPDGFAVGGRRLGGNHQLGGHARFIQHPVEEEVVQAHRRVYRRDGGFDAERWEQVKAEVDNWTVLFQFDSDDTLDLMWGDVGTLWWATLTAPAAARDFSSARFNFQCS